VPRAGSSRSSASESKSRRRTPRAQIGGIAERLDGRVLLGVEAVGKNLLLTFEGGYVLRSHLRMSGRWTVVMRGSFDGRAHRNSVYRKVGRPCPRCGEPIRSRGQGDANRIAYWCPRCQR
jgi:formamidopyrimidine-DNA glycosylase